MPVMSQIEEGLPGNAPPSMTISAMFLTAYAISSVLEGFFSPEIFALVEARTSNLFISRRRNLWSGILNAIFPSGDVMRCRFLFAFNINVVAPGQDFSRRALFSAGISANCLTFSIVSTNPMRGFFPERPFISKILSCASLFNPSQTRP